MAATESRPPSERGPEFETLDIIRTMSMDIEQLRKLLDRPYHQPSPWWDILPVPRPEVYSYFYSPLQMYINGGGAPWLLTVLPAQDRIDLQLKDGTGQPLWQRSLFWLNERPPQS